MPTTSTANLKTSVPILTAAAAVPTAVPPGVNSSPSSRPESALVSSEQVQDESTPTTTICEHNDDRTASDSDLKHASTQGSEAKPDIEHVYVHDDPRKWSPARKLTILAIIACASMLATFASNIYSPALAQIQADLRATDTQIASSLSSFIIVQGVAPLFWSSVSEVYGRKVAYLISEIIFIAGCIIVGTAKSITIVIAMRCFQAFGSSAVFSVGAGTLADIYDPHERGKMMGIYYAAPLLGPSLGPILGGALTQAWSWRATFYFLAAICALSLGSFFLFKDTFRRERSLVYQAALRRHMKAEEAHRKEAAAKEAKKVKKQQSRTELRQGTARPEPEHKDTTDCSEKSLEAQDVPSLPKGLQGATEVKLTLRDVNPLGPVPDVLRQRSNTIILIASGLLFAFSYSILYTCSRTFSNVYHYDSLEIGLVLLAYGIGSMCGSIFGGRWSDHALRRLQAKNGGKSSPEMRLESTKWAMPLLPLSSLAYAWLCQEKVHVAAVCTALFFAGFLSIWIYSSTLAYIVDANTGRSSGAVACNSAARGIFGFAAAMLAENIQNKIGDGGLYSIWAGLLVLVGAMIMLLVWRGREWREKDAAKEERRRLAKEGK